MSEWEHKSNILWTYRLTGAARPYGYVVQYQDAGRANVDWDAIVTVGDLDDEVTIAERVSFDEAKAAIEEHAQLHANHV